MDANYGPFTVTFSGLQAVIVATLNDPRDLSTMTVRSASYWAKPDQSRADALKRSLAYFRMMVTSAHDTDKKLPPHFFNVDFDEMD